MRGFILYGAIIVNAGRLRLARHEGEPFGPARVTGLMQAKRTTYSLILQIAAAALIGSVSILQAQELPAKMPVPDEVKDAQQRPDSTQQPVEEKLPDQMAVPPEVKDAQQPLAQEAVPSDDQASEDAAQPPAEQASEEPPPVAPVPPPRPEGEVAPPQTAEPVPEGGTKPADEAKPAEPTEPQPPKVTLDKPPLPSAEELACRTRLLKLGTEFKEATPSLEQNGCWMPHPVEVSQLTDKIAIEPPVVVNCATAESSARFLRDVASPAAKAELGSEIKSIAQASGFVCRPRAGTSKLSEHALGNALDIASFALENGKKVVVGLNPPEAEGKFMAKVRAAACGPFKTVLGPGSDADHAEHFHFDLAQRRNGGTFCQ